MQSFNDSLIILRIALNHPRDRIRKPLLELPMRLKYMRHQKMHKRPQFHQIILQRRSRQQQPPTKQTFSHSETLSTKTVREHLLLRLEIQQQLPPLRFKIFNVLRFVQNQVLPFLASETLMVLYD